MPVALGIDHLSCYSLTPEEGARLADSLIPDEDDAARMWELAGRCGLPRYEISNYAAPGCECRHNRNVWRGGLLTGLGPAAAGFDGTDRKSEPASLAGWAARRPAGDRRHRSGGAAERDLRRESAYRFRLDAGALGEGPERRTRGTPALPPPAAPPPKLCRNGFDISPERITLSDSGLLFWNTVAETIL